MNNEELGRLPEVKPHDNEVQHADNELGGAVLALKAKYNLTVLEVTQLLNRNQGGWISSLVRHQDD